MKEKFEFKVAIIGMYGQKKTPPISQLRQKEIYGMDFSETCRFQYYCPDELSAHHNYGALEIDHNLMDKEVTTKPSGCSVCDQFLC